MLEVLGNGAEREAMYAMTASQLFFPLKLITKQVLSKEDPIRTSMVTPTLPPFGC